nr:class I SAM-dependent methyltransferase [uncultured Methanolobus sp.]
MSHDNTNVCPVERSGSLDSSLRRWLQNPQKILSPYVSEGMEVLEIGCGPGFFTMDMGRMVGKSGRVLAVDLQEGMLQKVKEKIRLSGEELNIELHKCESDRLGVSGEFDLVFLFYVVHELPDQERFFKELSSLLKMDGRILIVEPPMHVSKKAFDEMLEIAGKAGFVVTGRPKMFPNKVVLLGKD